MPCTKCKDDNYKWGNTGECKYATKEACEEANPKKYSKMRPTPLGKKSYEEYAKELKEYNLSSAHRVELGLADDVEKQTLQAKEILSTLKEQKKKVDVEQKYFDKISNQREKNKDKSAKAADKFFALQDKYQKAEVAYDDAEEELKKSMRFLEESNKELKKLDAVLQKENNKAGKLSKSLVKNLNKLEKAAKDLGVKIPGVDNGYKIVNQLLSLLQQIQK